MRASRRAFLMSAAIAPAPAGAKQAEKVPTEPERLNAFAAAYNDYVTGINRGVVDVKRWRRVEKEWGKLVS